MTDATETTTESPLGEGAWVVLPTYNEAENLPGIAAAILEALPGATLLVVDDSSPDGTGTLAEQLGADDPGSASAIGRRSRAWAGRTSTGSASRSPAAPSIVIQMDADWSHDPAALPSLIAPDRRRTPRTSSSARATPQAAAWSGLGHRRGGSSRAAAPCSRRLVLRLAPNDLTGGFKAWRAVDPGGGAVRRRPRRRLRVPDRDDAIARSRLGARVAEVPITFRDRRVGQSKMSRRIIVEALFVVMRLRWDELRGRGPVPGTGDGRRPPGWRPSEAR